MYAIEPDCPIKGTLRPFRGQIEFLSPLSKGVCEYPDDFFSLQIIRALLWQYNLF